MFCCQSHQQLDMAKWTVFRVQQIFVRCLIESWKTENVKEIFGRYRCSQEHKWREVAIGGTTMVANWPRWQEQLGPQLVRNLIHSIHIQSFCLPFLIMKGKIFELILGLLSNFGRKLSKSAPVYQSLLALHVAYDFGNILGCPKSSNIWSIELFAQTYIHCGHDLSYLHIQPTHLLDSL